MEQSEGNIDCFVDFLGSGGTFQGCCKKLKEYNSNITCYAVEPVNAVVYAGKPLISGGAHKIQGCGYARDLPKIDRKLIDGYIYKYQIKRLIK